MSGMNLVASGVEQVMAQRWRATVLRSLGLTDDEIRMVMSGEKLLAVKDKAA
jgi:hypothetical protein